MITAGTSRRSRVARTVLVVLQVFLLLFAAVGPATTYAADPPASEEPTPSADPSPSAEPTPAPSEAPSPEPSAAPDPTAAP